MVYNLCSYFCAFALTASLKKLLHKLKLSDCCCVIKDNQIDKHLDLLTHKQPTHVLWLGSYSGIDQDKIRIERLTTNRFRNEKIEKDGSDKLTINNIPFADDAFDLVICYQVLEHVQDPLLVVRELKRIVEFDGKAFFQVPLNVDLVVTNNTSSSSSREREVLFGQEDHLRTFGMDFEDLLIEGGFRTQCIDYAGQFSEEQRKLMGLKLSYLTDPKESPYTTSENFYLATKA